MTPQVENLLRIFEEIHYKERLNLSDR